MPEKSPSRHEVLSAPTLSRFDDGSYLVKIDCAHCRVTRFYDPADLKRLCGDIPVRRIASRFSCQICNRKDYLTSALVSPSAKERVGMKVRRLVEIRLIRKPVWEDTKL